jgi:hypothetical protein
MMTAVLPSTATFLPGYLNTCSLVFMGIYPFN